MPQKPYRLEEQAKLIANYSRRSYLRLLTWVFADAALSASWHLEDGSNPELAMSMMEIANQVLIE